MEKLFGAKSPSGGRLISAVGEVSEILDDLQHKKQELSNKEYSIILENKDNYYISLSDFLKLMEKKDLSIRDIVHSCKHITEMKNKVSAIEIAAISEDGHITLCPDTKKCDKHKNYAGGKIRVTTIRTKEC
jgi:hypothetical protein